MQSFTTRRTLNKMSKLNEARPRLGWEVLSRWFFYPLALTDRQETELPVAQLKKLRFLFRLGGCAFAFPTWDARGSSCGNTSSPQETRYRLGLVFIRCNADWRSRVSCGVTYFQWSSILQASAAGPISVKTFIWGPDLRHLIAGCGHARTSLQTL